MLNIVKFQHFFLIAPETKVTSINKTNFFDFLPSRGDFHVMEFLEQAVFSVEIIRFVLNHIKRSGLDHHTFCDLQTS